ncbi:MAG: hypothetical protein COX57_06350 [Alphaproteobacteria bacterium CG_4_10_14_0_2_um_filter_63_37]|nr:MAG: hypothetical protein AUJ55_01830 [Proteobacteria bacterium CG1_02_64_396]PJA24934.1 MAG: hypothetical protein COX57_06350 [Alphaproteobacteria bacterium CG_4_10_14_0_2_um_filter_63_37]
MNLLWLLPGILAGVLAAVALVPLGREVLRRGIVFVDLAIAQVAATAVVAAHLLGWKGGWEEQLAALLAALSVAALAGLLVERLKKEAEAWIGVIYVAAGALTLLLLAHDPHGAEEGVELLSGQILWAGWGQAAQAAAVAGVVVLWGARVADPWRRSRPFYLILAASVTVLVQILGVFLVFALLIMPALAVVKLKAGWWWVGSLIGGLGVLGGMTASALADLPAGTAIVVGLAVLAPLVRLFLPVGNSREPSKMSAST